MDDTLKRLVGPPDLWEMKRAFQLDFLVKQGLMPRHSLLDFGCGVLRGGIPLISYLETSCYTGMDVRNEVLELGWQEVCQLNLQDKKPALIHVPEGIPPPGDQVFDFIWAFAVLFHISDLILPEVLSGLRQRMHAGSVFFANLHTGTREEGTWLEFPLMIRPWEEYTSLFEAAGLSIEDMGCLLDFGHVHPRLTLAEQMNQRVIRTTLLS